MLYVRLFFQSMGFFLEDTHAYVVFFLYVSFLPLVTVFRGFLFNNILWLTMRSQAVYQAHIESAQVYKNTSHL